MNNMQQLSALTNELYDHADLKKDMPDPVMYCLQKEWLTVKYKMVNGLDCQNIL